MNEWLIVSKAVQWGMGISRWIILIAYYYGHHVVYVGKHRLTDFQKVSAVENEVLARDIILIM